jgi:hypothetical protein
MEEQLITFETAKLAKEKGFKEKVLLYYSSLKHIQDHTENNGWGYFGGCDFNNHKGYRGDKKKKLFPYYSAPTQSLLQKWLREEHKIEVQPRLITSLSASLMRSIGKKVENYNWSIITGINNEEKMFEDFNSKTSYIRYEDALEAGLQEALKLICLKEKQ